MRKNIRFKTLREVWLEQAEKVNGRICKVDGEPAFFHRWVQDDRIVTQTFALVELLDGSVKKVAPEKVRFCDREEAEDSEEVKCKDCEFLMFSDFEGECSKCYKGIVSPNDSCGKGKRREAKR